MKTRTCLVAACSVLGLAFASPASAMITLTMGLHITNGSYVDTKTEKGVTISDNSRDLTGQDITATLVIDQKTDPIDGTFSTYAFSTPLNDVKFYTELGPPLFMTDNVFGLDAISPGDCGHFASCGAYAQLTLQGSNLFSNLADYNSLNANGVDLANSNILFATSYDTIAFGGIDPDTGEQFTYSTNQDLSVQAQLTSISVVTDAPSAVPEPASWALMIGGIGLAGMMLRRQHRVKVSFA